LTHTSVSTFDRVLFQLKVSTDRLKLSLRTRGVARRTVGPRARPARKNWGKDGQESEEYKKIVWDATASTLKERCGVDVS
jgi:hypothetical protein